MFFQETTPDTSGYMIAGYAITFLVMALYVVSIYVRSRNLRQDMTALEEMEEAASPIQRIPSIQPSNNGAKPSNNRSVKTVTKKARRK